MDDINTTEPFICKCSECMKLGPLYSSMNKKNSSLTPECIVINKDSDETPLITKKHVLNIGWVFIILFLLISSKFLTR